MSPEESKESAKSTNEDALSTPADTSPKPATEATPTASAPAMPAAASATPAPAATATATATASETSTSDAQPTSDEKSDEKSDENEKSLPVKSPPSEESHEQSTQQRPQHTSSYYSQSQYSYQPGAQEGFLGVPLGLTYPFFLHNNFLMLFIFIGMIFTLLGGIMSGSAIIANNSDIYGASVITISIGLFTISTFITLAALFREDLNHFIRLGLLITGAFGIFGLILYSRFGFGILT